jgi:hypothetical protein
MRLKRMPAMWTGDLIQERRGSGFTHGGDESFLNYDARRIALMDLRTT